MAPKAELIQYQVSYEDSNENKESITSLSTNTTLYGLLPGQVYTIGIRMITTAGDSPWSIPIIVPLNDTTGQKTTEIFNETMSETNEIVGKNLSALHEALNKYSVWNVSDVLVSLHKDGRR